MDDGSMMQVLDSIAWYGQMGRGECHDVLGSPCSQGWPDSYTTALNVIMRLTLTKVPREHSAQQLHCKSLLEISGNKSYSLFIGLGSKGMLRFQFDSVVTGTLKFFGHWPLARYVKNRVAHAPGMPGTFSPPPRVSDHNMHHGTCMMHVWWCMPRSLPDVGTLLQVK